MRTASGKQWLVVILAMAGLSAQAQPSCSGELYRHAESALPAASTRWPALHRHWRQYAACDDGALAEGYSEAVVRLLLERPQWPALNRITTQDAHFRHWLLGNVDESVSTADLQQLQVQTATCSSALCHAVQQALARTQARSTTP